LSRADFSAWRTRRTAIAPTAAASRSNCFTTKTTTNPGGCGVTDSHRIDFICAGCGARYKVVHVEADAGLPDHLLHCTACRKPLAATDREKNILKYFLVGRGRVRE
jgi:hypothetical protein